MSNFYPEAPGLQLIPPAGSSTVATPVVAPPMTSWVTTNNALPTASPLANNGPKVIPVRKCLEDLSNALARSGGYYFNKLGQAKGPIQQLVLVVELNTHTVFMAPFMPSGKSKSLRVPALRVQAVGPTIDNSDQPFTFFIFTLNEIATIQRQGWIKARKGKGDFIVQLYNLSDFLRTGLKPDAIQTLTVGEWNCVDQIGNPKPKAEVIAPIRLPMVNINNLAFFDTIRQALQYNNFHYVIAYRDSDHTSILFNLLLIIVQNGLSFLGVAPDQVTSSSKGTRIYMLYFDPQAPRRIAFATGTNTRSGRDNVASYLLLNGDQERILFSQGQLQIDNGYIGGQQMTMRTYLLSRDDFMQKNIPQLALDSYQGLIKAGIEPRMIENEPNLYISSRNPLTFR